MTITQKGLVIPDRFIWSRQKYEQATELGLLGPADRVELLDGEIVQKMPQNNRHQTAIGVFQELLGKVYSSGHWLRIQMQLTIGDQSVPEPDLAVVRGSWRDYVDQTPTGGETVLVVEVSDSTLASDRLTKAARYSTANIPEYWIVNLVENVLEIYRYPQSDDALPLGHGYLSTVKLKPGESLAVGPEFDYTVAVSDMLTAE